MHGTEGPDPTVPMYRIEVYILSTVVERLSALRALMKEKNIQAYIICTDDFHGSE